MNQTARRKQFRRAAEAECGMPVSAGARVAHLRLSVEAGHGIYLNLSVVAVERRAALINEIEQLVKQAVMAPAPKERGHHAKKTRTSR